MSMLGLADEGGYDDDAWDVVDIDAGAGEGGGRVNDAAAGVDTGPGG